jgi:hypothetical protein
MPLHFDVTFVSGLYLAMGAILAPNDAEVERTARSLFAQHGSQALGIAQRAAINVRGLGMTDQFEFWIAVAVAIRTMLNEGR